MNTERIPVQRSVSRQTASGYGDSWYERPFDAGAIAEQFFDSRLSRVKVCPETALMYAVLEDAFFCFQKKFETEQRFMRCAREAERWFFSDAPHWLFSFVSVCDVLGLEPNYIRMKLKYWTPPAGTRHRQRVEARARSSHIVDSLRRYKPYTISQLSEGT
jgi:hypothetical protein